MNIDKLTRGLKYTIFSLMPLVVLLAISEFAVRTFLPPVTHYQTTGLYEENAGLNVFDAELFWRNPKNFTTMAYGREVRTNRYGLRSPDFELKKGPDEYRILMLGESTTFGAGVSGEETYSAVLEKLLNTPGASRRVRVINAGISAYSSFQSLLYLKAEGLAFHPDLIVVYHEINDYLPSTVRNSGNTEVGTTMSDVELYKSATNRIQRVLCKHWKLYEMLVFQHARWSIRRLQQEAIRNPFQDIGIPVIAIQPQLVDVDQKRVLTYQNAPQRLKPEERMRVFKELLTICKEQGIGLLMIHPSYASSLRHTCLLTDFVRDNNVLCLEAYDILHQAPAAETFISPFHPNVHGHRLIAEALADLITNNRLIH
jgi:lysophospholipase L1-like esterase